jgi:hypothetical protein
LNGVFKQSFWSSERLAKKASISLSNGVGAKTAITSISKSL